jgi:hypothetical protein
VTFSAVLKGLFTATSSKCGTTLVSISKICEWAVNVYISTWLFVIADTSWWLRNISDMCDRELQGSLVHN